MVSRVAVVVHRRERVGREGRPGRSEAVVVPRALALAPGPEVMGVVGPDRVVGVLLELDEGRLGGRRRPGGDAPAAFQGPHPRVVVLFQLRAHRRRGRRVRTARASFPERAP